MPRKRRPPRPGALAELAPLRIFTQIVILQAAYYLCAALLIIFTALVAGRDLSFDLLFSWRTIRGDTTVGWMLGLIWLLNSLIRYEFLALICLVEHLFAVAYSSIASYYFFCLSRGQN